MGYKLSLLFPNQDLHFKTLSDVAFHDIGMDGVVKKLSVNENEQTYITNVMRMMTNDLYTARYRAEVFDDIYNNKSMREDLMKLMDRINFLREFGSFKRDHDAQQGVWDLLHRLDELSSYIECIEAIHKCLSDTELKSEGLNKLRDHVKALYTDNSFDALKMDIKALKADTRNLKSVTVGINLNERFEASGVGLISVNSKPFTKSGIVSNFVDKVTGADSIHDGNQWNNDFRYHEVVVKRAPGNETPFVVPALSPMALMSLKAIADSETDEKNITNYMDEIASRMLGKTARHLREILGRYVMLTITDITDIMPEFIYYVRWAEYIEKLKARGFTFCKPKVIGLNDNNELEDYGDSSVGQVMDARGIYNIRLIEDDKTKPSSIVPNNLSFDKKNWLYILTGANRGGKTMITQAIGQMYFLSQGGIYAPGTAFLYKPVECIYTHFPADEDKTLDLGRLGEECKRFKELFQSATSDSLLLLNETFSTTSFEEGYYIARDCIKAILNKGVRTIYNTHMHKLAVDVPEINEDAGEYRASSLIVVNKGSERSYEVRVAPPQGKSYASDIAEKYGVTYDMLTN